MSRRLLLGLITASLGLLAPLAESSPLAIVADDIGLSKAIPKVGDEVVFLVPVRNASGQPLTVSCRVAGTATDEDGRRSGFGAGELHGELKPGEAREARLAWRPQETGFYDLAFELSDAAGGASVPGHRAEWRRFAVVARDLYFAWFGAPRRFRWCNVPTTVKPEEVPYWLRRGALPCAWRGGVCYREWTKEQFVESWSSSPWIAIDEIGGPGADTDKFMAALREIKAAHPDHFAAVWFMGAHGYWADVKDVINLFLPEVYLNYGGNHLGTFEPYLDVIRRTGTMSQTVFGLGINIITDEKTKGPRVVPTKDDVLRQVRYVKRIAPAMPGLGFFTSDSAAPGVAEYADELCGEYFVRPVLTLLDQQLRVTSGKAWQVRATVANYGGMTARDVHVRCGIVRSDDALESAQTITLSTLAADERREIAVSLPRRPGIATVRAEIQPSPRCTRLDATAEELVASRDLLPASVRGAMALLQLPAWPEGDRRDVPAVWQLPAPVRAARVAELDPSGQVRADCPPLTEGPTSTVRWVAKGLTGAGQRRLFAVLPGPQSSAATPALARREGDLLRVTTPYYEATLNLATDEIVSLKPAASGTELLKSPWRLNCSVKLSAGPAVVEDSGKWLTVTIPVASDAAEGESRYVFSALTPAIEIARRFTPRAPTKITGAGEGCGLEQRGGTFALQPGVGGVVSRGSLRDGSEYRDLYFGYLATAPGEGNARRAGWLDFSWDERWNAGLGVAIAERWRDACSKEYDVTRLYDASDWIEVLHVWGTETTISREQTSRVFLVPHGYLDLTKAPAPPAEEVWETVHGAVRGVVW